MLLNEDTVKNSSSVDCCLVPTICSLDLFCVGWVYHEGLRFWKAAVLSGRSLGPSYNSGEA